MISNKIDKEVENIIFKIISKKNINKNKKLISSGIIDSLKVIEIISDLETKFKLKFSDYDLKLKNIDSINSIKKVIKKKLKK